MTLKAMILLLALAGMLSAAPVQEPPRHLMHKSGKKTLFLKADVGSLVPAEKAAAEKARLQSADAPHAGEVYYKKGIRSPAYRHITSGRIVVRFAEDSNPDPEVFAAENGLEYVRSIGRSKKSAVFVNKSGEDDISRSNALIQNGAVESAEPDWVLPVKLY
jgi:hypothetical protein